MQVLHPEQGQEKVSRGRKSIPSTSLCPFRVQAGLPVPTRARVPLRVRVSRGRTRAERGVLLHGGLEELCWHSRGLGVSHQDTGTLSASPSLGEQSGWQPARGGGEPHPASPGVGQGCSGGLGKNTHSEDLASF